MKTVKHAEFKDMWRPGRHTLVVGQPRSGKTSAMLFITKILFQVFGETLIVRDIGEFFEWFSMLDHGFEILGHVPQDCEIFYKHPNFTQMTFDVTKLTTLFNNLDSDKINLVFFESFCIQLKNYIAFWAQFFKKLLPWKQKPGRGEIPIALLLDEFGDLAPGKGRTFIPGQNQVSQLIAMNHRKFRRHNIRLIGAVHYFRDITPPIRERFDCYVIKQNYPNPKEVPYVLSPYAPKFPHLKINECLFVDAAKGFNLTKIKEPIKPKRFYNIAVRGNVDKLMSPTSQKSPYEKLARRWRARGVRLATALRNQGMPVYKIATIMETSVRWVQFLLQTAPEDDFKEID